MEMVFWWRWFLRWRWFSSWSFKFWFDFILFWLLFQLDSRYFCRSIHSSSSWWVLRSTVRPWELVDRVLIDSFSSEGAFWNVIVGGLLILTLVLVAIPRSVLGVVVMFQFRDWFRVLPVSRGPMKGFHKCFKFVVAVPAHSISFVDGVRKWMFILLSKLVEHGSNVPTCSVLWKFAFVQGNLNFKGPCVILHAFKDQFEGAYSIAMWGGFC